MNRPCVSIMSKKDVLKYGLKVFDPLFRMNVPRLYELNKKQYMCVPMI
jgi:hypothetical protein